MHTVLVPFFCRAQRGGRHLHTRCREPDAPAHHVHRQASLLATRQHGSALAGKGARALHCLARPPATRAHCSPLPCSCLLPCHAECVCTPDLKQQADRAAALERWMGVVAAANPGAAVDPASGRVTVQLAQATHATLDYLVMLPSWQMTRSNYGSIALLRRAA